MLSFLGLPKWIVIAAVAISSAAAGAWGMAKLKNGEIARIELAHAEALVAAEQQARATQKRIDDIALEATERTVEIKLDIVMKTATIVKEIPFYVQDTSTCITVGLIRVLDAAALGADPADLPLAPGEFNETCAGIGSVALAASVAENYGRYHLVAADLTGLQNYVRGLEATLNSRPSS